MAHNFSDEQLRIAEINAYGKFYPHKSKLLVVKIIRKIFINYYLIKVNIINLARKIEFKLQLIKKTELIGCKLTVNFNELAKKQMEEKQCTFIEKFFNNDFYILLLKNFPTKNIFFKQKKIVQNSYSALIYQTNLNNDDKIIFFPYYVKLYEFLKGYEFENAVNNFFGNKEKLKLYSIGTHYSEENSYLIPHQDGIIKLNKNTYNFIYFLDGEDDDIEHSGGTEIHEDNNLQKLILKPSTLKNSCLIYNSSADFFHGYKVLKKNCFRKALTFQFLPEAMIPPR